MSRRSPRRLFFFALAILLAAFAAYSVVALVVSIALNRFRHFRVAGQIGGILLILALAVLGAWLARRSWHAAKSN